MPTSMKKRPAHWSTESDKTMNNTPTILLIAAALITPACDSDANRFSAENNAAKWSKSMGYTLKGRSCSALDSDGDGYVTCTANVEGQPLLNLQCQTRSGGGCKLTEGKIQIGKVRRRSLFN